ncbi:hypothetical protein V5799_017951 [Amblyomma americanum]|uniref:Ankyrin n=1 Tax=Amblyomma americanum TaxID=6943 RepID=A0AAQ4F0P1_AMBAM
MGFTPLHYVAKFVRPEKRRSVILACEDSASLMIQTLMSAMGTGANAIDAWGMTPLHHASLSGNSHVVRCLLPYTSVDKEVSALSTVMIAADKNTTTERMKDPRENSPTARVLECAGVDPNFPSSTGLTALHLAAMRSGVPMCELLVKHGATTDVLADGNKTPLYLAATNDRPLIVAFLLDQGACIEDRDVEGNSPLLGAVDSGSVEVVQLLLDRGADIESRNNDDRNVLHMAVLSKNEDVLQILLRHGAKASAKNSSEETTLHAACHYNYPNVVREIVKQDARLVNETDIHWNTPLHVAAQGGYSETAAILVEAGADLEAKNYYEWTPLTVACKKGNFDTVSKLLGAGASVNSVDKMKVDDFYTRWYYKHGSQLHCNSGQGKALFPQNRPLHIAAQFGNTTVVDLLLERKDVRDFVCKRNANKKNCLDIAIEEDHRGVVEALLKSKFWRELLQNSIESDQYGTHQTPLRSLIRTMPDLATLVFDNCVLVEAASDEDPNKSVTYQYQFLDDAFCGCGHEDSDDDSDSDSDSTVPGEISLK